MSTRYERIHALCAVCRRRTRRRLVGFLLRGRVVVLGNLLRPWTIGRSAHPVEHSRLLDVCVDVQLLNLVEQLNRDGLRTTACCQGPSDVPDVPPGKPPFINFGAVQLPELRAWLERRDLTYTEHHLTWRGTPTNSLPMIEPPLWNHKNGGPLNRDVHVALDVQGGNLKMWLIRLNPATFRGSDEA